MAKADLDKENWRYFYKFIKEDEKADLVKEGKENAHVIKDSPIVDTQ